MSKVYEGMLQGKGLKLAIVIARFNEFITGKLLDGAQDAMKRHGVNEADIDIAWAPGSFEIPLVAKKLAETKKYDAIICLGAVIRGATPHFEYVANEVSKGHCQSRAGCRDTGGLRYHHRRQSGTGHRTRRY